MSNLNHKNVVIVDYGLGNLFSVKRACEIAGLSPVISSFKEDVVNADALILPGVGAFGDAMQSLADLDLIEPLRDAAMAQKTMFGICLGFQLLMSMSYEFGEHEGLNILPGSVVRFDVTMDGDRTLKVPEVCWNKIYERDSSWETSFLQGTQEGEYMYFVHSYYVKPDDEALTLSRTNYGGIEFCSSIQRGSLFACQFHPERSGVAGLRIYKNFAKKLMMQEARG